MRVKAKREFKVGNVIHEKGAEIECAEGPGREWVRTGMAEEIAEVKSADAPPMNKKISGPGKKK